ncbi:MAG TPA: peptide ABC transporter substrate-binding protein [Gemmatimonadaceae bacterium]|nr:peptide ABC transporter substrate-binding protein [Gemmatimonadaceae bacterium]
MSASTLLATLAMSACGATPSRDGVAVMASGADLESANPVVTVHPLARQVQRHVLLLTLTRYDSTLAQVPYLARRWTWAPSRRSVALHLLPGVRWHDGAPLDARDVAFTFDLVRDPATASPRAGELAMVSGTQLVDDTTFIVRFATPQGSLPPAFAELPIAPEHLLRDVPRSEMRRAPFALAPVGAGPFRFLRRDAGQRWVFERDDAFPAALGGPPALHRLVIAVVDEPATKMAGLVSGDLDVAGIAPTMASLAARDPRLRVVEYPILFSVGLFFNPTRAPLDDRRVREAISLSIDRKRLVEAVVAGYGVPAAGPVPPELPFAATTSQVDARRAAARADSLLDAAGWRRGADGVRTRAAARLELELLTVGSGENAAEQLLQDDLAKHGMVVRIRQMELGAFLAAARARPRTFDMLYTGIPGDLALSHLVAMYESRYRDGALDYSGFHAPELDAAFARVRSAGDASELAAAWRGLQATLAHETPAAWIYHSRGIQGVARRLDGVAMDLRGELATVTRWRTR